MFGRAGLDLRASTGAVFGPGTVVAEKYRLGPLIAEGGMGQVFEAEQLLLARRVAIKVLGTDDLKGDRLAAFLREARIAAAVQHRNVVQIIDFGLHQGNAFLAMELLHGESLFDRMAHPPEITVTELVRWFEQALCGLAAVHDAGVVHRDIKPENIILVEDSDGLYPKLIDFGISRSLNADLGSAVPTVTGMFVGTPLYMSPEQACGRRDLDHRSDLFSMGVLIYEALAGKPPFFEKATGDMLLSLLTREPEPLSKLRPDLGDATSDVVRRALSKDPHKRFQSARDMRDALLKATRGLPETARAGTKRPAGEPSASASLREPNSVDATTVQRHDTERDPPLSPKPNLSASPAPGLRTLAHRRAQRIHQIALVSLPLIALASAWALSRATGSPSASTSSMPPQRHRVSVAAQDAVEPPAESRAKQPAAGPDGIPFGVEPPAGSSADVKKAAAVSKTAVARPPVARPASQRIRPPRRRWHLERQL